MASIKDVARATGLSIGTISRYINGKSVKEKNRNLIQETIEQLNYRPNNVGKYLRTGKTKTIGVISANIASQFISRIGRLLEKELLAKGYDVVYCSTHDSVEYEKLKLDYMASRMTDAIVLFPVSYTQTDISSVEKNDTPIILANNIIENCNCPSVVFDNVDAAYNAVTHFIDNGHSRIACLYAGDDVYGINMRIDGYKKALLEAGIPFDPELLVQCDFDDTRTHSDAAVQLLSISNPPTAILIATNEPLVGFLSGVESMNKRVPDDISYIVFDEADYYRLLNIKPTYIYQPKTLFNQYLCESITAAIDGTLSEPNQMLCVKTKLIQGNSVKNFHAGYSPSHF